MPFLAAAYPRLFIQSYPTQTLSKRLGSRNGTSLVGGFPDTTFLVVFDLNPRLGSDGTDGRLLTVTLLRAL